MKKKLKISGFTYLSLLILIAIISICATATVQIGAIQYRKLAETELLAIGKEYRQALLSYAIATPLGQNNRPTSIDDLLKDPRFPKIKRHLRRVYQDPITGSDHWGIIISPDGLGISGIHSKSQANPIKVGNFPSEFEHFSNKNSYTDWIFTADHTTK